VPKERSRDMVRPLRLAVFQRVVSYYIPWRWEEDAGTGLANSPLDLRGHQTDEVRGDGGVYAKQNPERDQAIAAAYASGGYSVREIGDFSGSCHYSRVSKIVRSFGAANAKETGKT